MSDIKINGHQQTYTPLVGTQSVPGPSETSSGVSITTSEEESPLLGTGTSENLPPEGDVPDPTASAGAPDPNGDPMERAAWLETELQKQEDYLQLAEQLEEIVASSGPDAAKAQSLLTKLRQAMWTAGEFEDAREELDELADHLPDADLDGDGVANQADPDLDGDGLTDEAEIANGTNQYDQDSDHDGITDYGELWLKQHNYAYGWMDANNPDANKNGILDGNELPETIKKDNNGKPITVGGKAEESSGSGSGSTNSNSGVGSTSNNYQWNPPSGGAKTLDASKGDQTVSADYDVVVNANGGNLDFSKDGNDLLVETSTGTIRVTGYYGADGTPQGKVYIEGTAESVSTKNGSNLFTAADTNGDGYADTGIHFASEVKADNVTNHYDPFDGAVVINESESTEDTQVYDANGANGTFTVPSEIDGTEVKAVELKVEGNDVLVVCKGSLDGDPLKTFRLKGGKNAVKNGSIQFKLADNGQSFYAASIKCRVDGGKGDDKITIKGGTAKGGDGSDMLQAGDEAATLDGGRGIDYVLGGSDVDTLIGGDEDDGMDFLYSGSSTGDTLRGGNGDDEIIVDNTGVHAHYNLQGGEGVDITNSANADLADSGHGIEIGIANPSGILNYLDQKKVEADQELMNQLDDLHNGEGNGDLDWIQSAASEAVKNAALTGLMNKKKEWDAKYGGGNANAQPLSGSQNSQNPENPPPPSEGTTTQSAPAPGLMFQSFSVEEDRRRRRDEEEGVSDDGDIPSPMFD